MHKKLGPLEAWQWAAILAGLLLVYYEYEKSKTNAAAASTAGTSPTDTSGAIDPTTGIPYADEIGAGAGYGASGSGGGVGDSGSTDSGTSLQQELSDLGAIEGLMGGLGGGLGLGGTGAGGLGDTGAGGTYTALPATFTPGTPAKTIFGRRPKLPKPTVKGGIVIGGRHTRPAAKKGYRIKGLGHGNWEYTPIPKRKTRPANHKNPGHHVTLHVGGARVVSSSAPHSSQQHVNIAPPSHQRATHRPATAKPYAIKPPARKKKKARRR